MSTEKEKLREIWERVLGSPNDCKFCAIVRGSEVHRFCFYWINYPDGKSHPCICLGRCEHYERRNKDKENVGETAPGK